MLRETAANRRTLLVIATAGDEKSNMTLHWWMHWFWITRTQSVITLLLLLFVSGQCVPVNQLVWTEEAPPASEEDLGPRALPVQEDPILKLVPRDVTELNVTTASHDTNSSTRTSKSLPTSPKVAVESVTDKVKVKKADHELNDSINSSIIVSKYSSVPLNVSESESVNISNSVFSSTVEPPSLLNSSQRNDSHDDGVLEKFGRAASHSIDNIDEEDDTTDIPSVAPISKSRISGPLPNNQDSGLDAAAITGIALGIVVFAGLSGAVSFVLYRRRYLNKPQTLNDKCSNPDSSGYIDDSTLRENSEEMYSLDNDSFLNSLEAMTIQNYWTDNQQETCWRHTGPC